MGQQLVDCDPSSNGCSGGWLDKAYDYISSAGGIVSQSDYPYTGVDGECNVPDVIPAAMCSGARAVEATEGALQEAVGNVGPISVALCGLSSAFQQYSGGIFDNKHCGTQLTHAVAAVGYDTNQNYWIVRNEWGTSWGEDGYMRMIKGKNMCGVLSHSCYPNV